MIFKSNAKYNVPVETGSVYRAKTGNVDVIIHRIHGIDGWVSFMPYFRD